MAIDATTVREELDGGDAREDFTANDGSIYADVLDLLRDKVALRSISSRGVGADHMRRSAEFVAAKMREAGVSDAHVVQSRNSDGTPGAFEVIGAKVVDPKLPTVMLYAHHDVVDVPDASEWEADPFTARIVDTRMFGRGATDDGGGIAIHYGALRLLAAHPERFGCNVKLFFEGEEEVGSPSFIPFLSAHCDEFDCDAIIVADSGNWDSVTPSLTTSLRGNTQLNVTVRVLRHPVHSGQFGGPIVDATTAAAMLIASMYDDGGDLVVPGLMAQDPVGGLQRDLDPAQFRADAGAVDSLRFAGTGSLASRDWTKPSVSVTGFDATPVDAAINVIADSARFRLSVRTAPQQRPEDAQKAMAEFLTSHAPFGAEVSVEPLENGMGWAMDPDSKAVRLMETAMAEAFGVDPVNKGEGGSIPFIPELQQLFPHAQVIVTGPEDPQANAHSPNESVSLPLVKNGIIAETLFLSRFGAPGVLH